MVAALNPGHARQAEFIEAAPVAAVQDGLLQHREEGLYGCVVSRGRDSTHGSFVVPSADVEIDFDVEWDSDEKVYLWGALIRLKSGDVAPQYVSFVDWGEVADGGLELARNFAMWVRGVVTEATAAGQTVAVYHYTSPEKRYLQNLLWKDHVADLTEHFIDLHALIRHQFSGLNGLGLKMVAKALGFAWQADDAGGLQSQTWLEIARDTGHPEHEAMRDRILAYNEDDVTATAIVRYRITTVSTVIEQLEAR